VGVTGYTLGGGVSLLTRSHGLIIDHVLEFTIVTANEEVKVVNETTDPELFWALRGGGGGNFGIITSMKFRTFRTASEELLSGSLCWKMESAKNLIRYYNNEWIYKVPNQMAGYGAYFLSRREFCILFLHNGDYNEVCVLLFLFTVL
jgi:FAD/FMN-containing dehydrogenase